MYEQKPRMSLHIENKFATEDISRKWTILEQKNRGGAEMVTRIISGPPLRSMNMLQSMMKEFKCQVALQINYFCIPKINPTFLHS